MQASEHLRLGASRIFSESAALLFLLRCQKRSRTETEEMRLHRESKMELHKRTLLINSNNKPAPGMAIMNSNGASPGFVFRCLEKAK